VRSRSGGAAGCCRAQAGDIGLFFLWIGELHVAYSRYLTPSHGCWRVSIDSARFAAGAVVRLAEFDA
jgi:hypothetical protein